MVGNARLLKDINRKLIINEIRRNAPISRAEIIEKTGLALPTVLRNINALIEEGYVFEVGKGESLSGRKPIMLEICPNAARIIGISVGACLEVVLADYKGGLLDAVVDYEVSDEDNLPEEIAKHAYEIVGKILEKHHLEAKDIAGVGIGTPGFNFKIGKHATPQYFRTAWAGRDRDPYACFHENFSAFPNVLLEHFPICGALGEQWFGKTERFQNSIYITVGTGVGSGIIIDGKVYGGKDGFAGHIGHTVVDPSGIECYCGNRGCLETFTGIPYIIDACVDKIKSGLPSSLTERFKNDDTAITLSMIAQEAENRDALCQEVLINAGEILGLSIANAINTLNPDVVVLSGMVVWQSKIFAEKAIACAYEHVFSNKARELEIIISDIHTHVEAQGAVALVLSELYRKPTIT